MPELGFVRRRNEFILEHSFGGHLPSRSKGKGFDHSSKFFTVRFMGRCHTLFSFIISRRILKKEGTENFGESFNDGLHG